MYAKLQIMWWWWHILSICGAPMRVTDTLKPHKERCAKSTCCRYTLNSAETGFPVHENEPNSPVPYTNLVTIAATTAMMRLNMYQTHFNNIADAFKLYFHLFVVCEYASVSIVVFLTGLFYSRLYRTRTTAIDIVIISSSLFFSLLHIYTIFANGQKFYFFWNGSCVV